MEKRSVVLGLEHFRLKHKLSRLQRVGRLASSSNFSQDSLHHLYGMTQKWTRNGGGEEERKQEGSKQEGSKQERKPKRNGRAISLIDSERRPSVG